jgi:hypothetical protein
MRSHIFIYSCTFREKVCPCLLVQGGSRLPEDFVFQILYLQTQQANDIKRDAGTERIDSDGPHEIGAQSYKARNGQSITRDCQIDCHHWKKASVHNKAKDSATFESSYTL